ncbi:Cysteine-rich secretory protein family protein [Cognatiyoonia koreensis]|uniref:Cysteine-rich secretory protein family protein n=1 Tax=Cognatiyoonia koreensis TaxID=364200 RepID=A0A1I0QRF1_9RHOB|nr:CAP domain-containing protein [Cognatiyoonia koreensis]SEW30163.1 Cysteine-rich secretory protein family protein [Cognatiyoonia koreensis]
MKYLIAIPAMLALTACGGASIGLDDSVSRGAPSTYGIEDLPVDKVEDASFGSILNGLRDSRGIPAVTYDARLDQAAQAHADDMVERGFFSHVNPDGENEYDRIVATGYNPRSWGENLAGRQTSEADALVTWINSAEHNRLLNAETVNEYGLGVAGSGRGTRWVLVMASERD